MVIFPLTINPPSCPLNSSHNRGHNVDSLHTIWLLAFELNSISYINSVKMRGMMDGGTSMEMEDGSS